MRLFIALPIPADIAWQLDALKGGVPNLRWVPQQNYHLTLRFLGNLDGGQMQDVDAALAGIRAPGFTLRCHGVDCFSSGSRIKNVWAGIEKQPALMHLRDKVESAVVRAGLAPNGQKFTPHVTLAYAKDQVPQQKLHLYLAEHNLFRSQAFPVTHFILYSSLTGGDHSVYRAERLYELTHPKEEARV